MPYGRATRTIFALFFLSQTFSFALTMLPTLLMSDHLITSVQAGMILAAASLLSGLCQPTIGIWLDKGRLTGTCLLVCILYSLGIYAFASPDKSLAWLVSGAFGLSLAMTSLRTLLATALMGGIPPHQRGRTAGTRYLIANTAMGVSALIAFAWLDSARGPLLVADLVTTWLLSGGTAWLLLRERRYMRVVNAVAVASDRFAGYRLLLAACRQHTWQIGGLSLIGIGFLVHASFIPLYFVSGGLAATKLNAVMLMTNTLGVAVMVRFVTRWTARWSEGRRVLAGAALIGGGLACAPLLPSLSGVAFTTLIWTLGEVVFVPWQQAKLYDYLPASQPGVASGALILLASICSVVAPLIGTGLLMLPTPVAMALLLALPFSGLLLFRIGGMASKRQAGTVDLARAA